MEQKIRGLIGYYRLTEWWLSEFSEEERNHIVTVYTPMGSGQDILLKDNYGYLEDESDKDIIESVVKFLYILAGWFDNKKDRYLAIRILVKAEELFTDKLPIMDIHFFYQSMVQIHYRNRLVDTKSYDKAIWACEHQIEIGPQVSRAFKKESTDGFMPSHVGYYQLAIIKEKEIKYQQVIDLCLKALKEGWRGDWQRRIDKCQAKLNRR